MELKKSKKK